MSYASTIARAEEALAFRPHTSYKMGAGPSTLHYLAERWHWLSVDCSSLACWCAGVAKHDGRKWWGTHAIYADAEKAQKRWRVVPFVPGCLVVYPGHMGIVVGGSEERPETIESASSKGGLWRGERTGGWWRRKGAIFVAPIEVKP